MGISYLVCDLCRRFTKLTLPSAYTLHSNPIPPIDGTIYFVTSLTGILYGSYVGPIWTALWAPHGPPTSDPKQSVRRAELGYPCGLPTLDPIHFVHQVAMGLANTIPNSCFPNNIFFIRMSYLFPSDMPVFIFSIEKSSNDCNEKFIPQQ